MIMAMLSLRRARRLSRMAGCSRVGGQEFGEIASRVAIDSMIANFRNSSGGEMHSTLLLRLIQDANHEVYERGHSIGPGGVAMAAPWWRTPDSAEPRGGTKPRGACQYAIAPPEYRRS
jgi:hypothetical protein